MKLLLDTHTLIWWFATDDRMTQQARNAIYAADTIYVSAISAFEIATKHGLGKLPEAGPMLTDLAAMIEGEGFEPLPLTVSDGLRAGKLPPPHKDPWDRMLIAQALNHDLMLVSNETPFDAYGVNRLW